MLVCLIEMMIEFASHFTFVSLEILSLHFFYSVERDSPSVEMASPGSAAIDWSAPPPLPPDTTAESVGSVVIPCKFLYFHEYGNLTPGAVLSRDTLPFSLLRH